MKIEYIPIDEIYLDVENPRSKYSDPTVIEDPFGEQKQAQTSALLRQQDGDGATGYSVQALKQSIRQSGGIVNPIWIKKVSDKWVCIEGNTRLCIYKDLMNDEPNNETWKTIPSITYTDITSDVENKLKLTAHIVGTREWKPYNKAKYVIDLIDSELTFEEISEIVGGQVGKLKKQVQAVHKFDKHYLPIAGGDKSNRQFSHFVVLEENPTAQFALQENQISMDEFAKWVLDKKFGMAINVRDLKKIVDHPQAFQAFKDEGYNAARKYLEQDDEVNLGDVDTRKLSDEVRKRLETMNAGTAANDKELILSLLNLGTSINSFWDEARGLGYKEEDFLD
tara:strand:+ start:198 stop:1208 length:1011 start_codon:yes stop_codon:yes gene_type:complete